MHHTSTVQLLARWHGSIDQNRWTQSASGTYISCHGLQAEVETFSYHACELSVPACMIWVDEVVWLQSELPI